MTAIAAVLPHTDTWAYQGRLPGVAAALGRPLSTRARFEILASVMMGPAYRSCRSAPRRYRVAMHSFFDSMTPWLRLDGSLHVYALPDEAVVERLIPLSERLDGVAFLPRLPVSWLHLTVSRLAHFDDLGASELSRLASALDTRISGISAFEVECGAPVVRDGSVVCAAPATTQWDALVTAVRAAAADLSDEPLPNAPQNPHVTLAYATGDVDDSEVARRLEGAAGLGAVPIRRIHLVSVTMRPELGSFDWTELANWELPQG